VLSINIREDTKGQSRMYNPERSVTLDTQDTGRRQTNENKRKQQHYTKNGAREEQAVPASYKIPVVLLIYIYGSWIIFSGFILSLVLIKNNKII
jgi:hypothetical protein